MGLLDNAIKNATDALRSISDGDAIASDLHVQAARPLLRKLFACREIGDGFGAIIDALISGFENNRGAPLDNNRLQAVHKALLKLRDEPFLIFAAAIQTIDELERAGFSTEPPGFEQLADWLTA